MLQNCQHLEECEAYFSRKNAKCYTTWERAI
jgi:hypothetical protein